MSGRILIVDSSSASRILCRTALHDASYDCHGCHSLGDAEAAVERSSFDVLIMEIPVGDAPLRQAVAFCRRIAARQQTRDLPVLVIGGAENLAPGGPTRAALLEAGAAELMTRPVDPALLQARIRGLMRARTVSSEMRMAEETRVSLGFAEGAADLSGPARTILLSRAAEGDRRALAATLPGRVECHPPFADLGAAGEVDLVVLDGRPESAHPVEELFRVTVDLRSRLETRHAQQLVVVPRRESWAAAMLLDLGADDHIDEAAAGPEIALRARRLLTRKARADRLRRGMMEGLQAAATDPLTGLHNRRYALPHLDRLARHAHDARQELAVLVLDIDHFKRINDARGHAAGDAVLAGLSRRLRDALRPADLLARLGGEEFLIALPATGEVAAMEIAERLRSLVEQDPFPVAGEDHHDPGTAGPGDAGQPAAVTLSIGVALQRPTSPAATADRLVERADAALYEAKRRGRNTWCLWKEAAAETPAPAPTECDGPSPPGAHLPDRNGPPAPEEAPLSPPPASAR